MKFADNFINAYEYNTHKINDLLNSGKDVVITNRFNSNRWIFFYLDNTIATMSLRMIGQPFLIVSMINKNIQFSYFNGVSFALCKNIDELKSIAEKEVEVKEPEINLEEIGKKNLFALFNN